MVKQLTTIEKVADKVQLLCVLECEMELDDERVVDHLHNVSLDLCVSHLLRSNNLILFERLHCVNRSIRLFLDHVHFTK